MANSLLFFGWVFLLSASLWGAEICFLVEEKEIVLWQEGDCHTRHSPCSTFKIALSLMGYQEGILLDENTPEFPFQEGYLASLEQWKTPHTPQLWIQNSCVWYSHILTRKLGKEKFQSYLSQFAYGNQDALGDKGKDNGLTHSWLGSSLEISVQEQVLFLQKLVENRLPVSRYAQKMTKNLLFLEKLPEGWTLYGKTGSGSKRHQDSTACQFGWFVGWIQKGTRKVLFACYLEDDTPQKTYAGLRAKEATKKKLREMLFQDPFTG